MGFRPASDVLKSGPECRRLRQDGVGMPEASRREKLRILRPVVANLAEVARGQRNPVSLIKCMSPLICCWGKYTEFDYLSAIG